MARVQPRDRKQRDSGAAPNVPAAPTGSEDVPTREQLVRCRAFELFEARMRAGRPGDADADWLQAEREVDAELAGAVNQTGRS